MIRPSLSLVSLAVGLSLLAGCASLAPPFHRPEAPVPTQWRADGATATTGGTEFSSNWRDVVTDSRLSQVIELALANNRDLRQAAANIEVARATYRIQRSALTPSVNGSASATRQHTPATASPTGQATTSNSYSVQLGLAAWELDLFGRVRNLSSAALQSFFSRVETQRSTRLALVAEVATAWLTLAADQELLALAQETASSRERSWSVQDHARALGGTSALTVAQARASLEAARADIATYVSRVEQDRNALDLLAGTQVGAALLPQVTDSALAENGASRLVELPAGLPSTVLAERPDVRAAEHTLRSSNASIGAARAAFFPSISLTASAGAASTSLNSLFSGSSGAWSFVPSISIPIFDGGANRARLDSATAQQQADLAAYEKTVQTAFRELADALAVRARLAERLAALSAQVEASQKALELSQALYREGASGYLELLDAQRTRYATQQSLISLRLAEQSNRVNLYKVLGGGADAEPVKVMTSGSP